MEYQVLEFQKKKKITCIFNAMNFSTSFIVKNAKIIDKTCASVEKKKEKI